MFSHMVYVVRFNCFDLAHMLNKIYDYLFSTFKFMLLIGTFYFWKKDLEFEFSLGQQNMQKKLNNVLFIKHIQHKNLQSAIRCRNMQMQKKSWKCAKQSLFKGI